MAESEHKSDDETVHITADQKLMILCNNLLVSIHRMTVSAFYLVIPYYVLDTPENGWSESDLALIIGTFCVGNVTGSQSINLTSLIVSNASLKIFIAHFVQIIFGTIGWFTLSSLLFGFNYPLFVFGCFLLGVNYDGTTVQSYADLISGGNEEIEISVMKNIGIIMIATNVFNALTFPNIYDYAGFTAFCSVSFGIQCIGLLILLLKWHTIRRCAKERVIINDDNEEQHSTEEEEDEEELIVPSLYKLLSPSMILSVFIMFMAAYSLETYYVAYPIVFASQWNISSSIGGYLNATSNVFSFIVLNVFLRYSDKMTLFKYPFNIIAPIAVFIMGNAMYLIVYKPFIAYSFHWMMSEILRVVFGEEMICRIFLCPPNVFRKVTQIIGFSQIGYLIAATTTPILFNVDAKLPFLILFIANCMLVVVILTVFYRRKAFLSIFYPDVCVNNYLIHERMFYERMHNLKERREAVMAVQCLKHFSDEMRHSNMNVTAMLFAPMTPQIVSPTHTTMLTMPTFAMSEFDSQMLDDSSSHIDVDEEEFLLEDCVD